MRASCSFGLDTAFLTGNGVGKPLGILNDPALITVAKEAGQANDTIIVENIDKMFARMHPAGRTNAVWVINSTAIPQLLSLTRSVGTGGSVVPVMSETAGTFSMLTRPVLFTEKVPALGDAGDILFVDFREYMIGMRKEVVLDKSNAVGWATDEMAYRTILRVDGRGRWTAPVTPLNGDTLSWCVKLAAR